MNSNRNRRTHHRLWALIDLSAWALIAPALIALFLLDPAMAKSIMQWCLPAIAISGIAIIVSRIIFPQIHLQDLIEDVKQGNLPAAIVVAATVIFVGIVFAGLVVWAKA